MRVAQFNRHRSIIAAPACRRRPAQGAEFAGRRIVGLVSAAWQMFAGGNAGAVASRRAGPVVVATAVGGADGAHDIA